MHRTKILAGLFSDAYVNANIQCNDGRQLHEDEIVAITELLAEQSTTATSYGCKKGYLSNSLHLLTLCIKGSDGEQVTSLPIFSSVKATRISGSISFSYDLAYNPEYIYLSDLLSQKINLFQQKQRQSRHLQVVDNQMH